MSSLRTDDEAKRSAWFGIGLVREAQSDIEACSGFRKGSDGCSCFVSLWSALRSERPGPFSSVHTAWFCGAYLENPRMQDMILDMYSSMNVINLLSWRYPVQTESSSQALSPMVYALQVRMRYQDAPPVTLPSIHFPPSQLPAVHHCFLFCE
jgi:hypothetical protein